MNGSTNLSVDGSATAINGGTGATDIVSSTTGMDLRTVTLSNIATVQLDSDNAGNTSGSTDLLVNNTTNFNGATVAGGSTTNHIHIVSDNGMDVSGMTLFSGPTTSSPHSLLLDNDTATTNDVAVLTLNSSTNLTGGTATTVQIFAIEGGSTNNDDIITSTNGMNLSGAEIQDVATINVNSDNSGNDTLTMNGSTRFSFDNSATTIAGGASTLDEISNTTGNANFEDVTLSNIGIQIANNSGLSQTVFANSGSNLFTGGIEFFDGSGGTNDVFDYTSALVAGDGTAVASGTNITLTEVNTQLTGTTDISANSTGAIEFNYTQAYLSFDLDTTAAATVITNIEALLNASSTLTSGGVLAQGVANTDMLFVFYEASGQGSQLDAVVARYQEGATSEASFSGEITLLADFHGVAAGDLSDASFA